MSPVQTAHTIVELVPYRVFRDAVERPTDQVPEGMAAEYISAEKDNIQDQDEASDADPEAVRETKTDDCVIDQKCPYQVGETQKVAMEILHDQGKASFAEIGLARLTYRARRRVGPKRLVVGAAVVVTGEAKEARYPQDKKRRRKVHKIRIPRRLGTEEGVGRGAEEFRRIEG